MTHRIISAKALGNMTLSIVFQNGTEKEYDIRQLYSIFPQFKELETTYKLFQQVTVDAGGYGVSWNDELDLDADTIWEYGITTVQKQDVGTRHSLAASLIHARELSGMTQKQLSDAVGMYQADISKIERGLANPSVSTLERLAKGMGTTLQITFLPNTKDKK